MDDKKFICPICGAEIKRGDGHHIKSCVDTYVNNLTLEKKEEIINLYNSGYSMVDMSKHLGFKYSLTEKILKRLNLYRRSIKDATSQQRRKDKYRTTCMEHFGTPHNFSKECSSRKEWEKRLFEEEGITNVFQRESVKEKIKNTMFEKYGEEGWFENRRKGNFIEYYIEKYGEEKGKEYFQWVQNRKKTANTKEFFMEKYGDEWETKWDEHLDKQKVAFTHNCGLNDKCEEMLKKHEIIYEREFKIKSEKHHYFYDFIVGNLIIELYGVYWHCSPKKYKPNDLVKFPNNKFIKAIDKWDYDKEKNDFAKSIGYKVIVIWEDEFNEETLLKILNTYNNGKDKN